MNNKIKNLIDIEIKLKEIDRSSIYFTPKTQKWCILPYYGHKKGCPNYNKNPLCPPNAPFLEKLIEIYNHFYLIYARFSLLKYKKIMLNKHPNWSERQATCILYWQNSVKKYLKEYIKQIYKNNHKNSFYLFSSGSGYKTKEFTQEKIYSMEAIGINVFKTLNESKIDFEIKPKNYVLLVNLLCSKNKIIF